MLAEGLLAGSVLLLGGCASRPMHIYVPKGVEEAGSLRLQMTLRPKMMLRLGQAHLVVQVQGGPLPEAAGYIIAWEPGCKTTWQGFEGAKRIYSFSHDYHSGGKHLVYFALVDLQTEKIVASDSVELQIGGFSEEAD